MLEVVEQPSVQSLVLCWAPRPHVALQLDHSFHAVKTKLTASFKSESTTLEQPPIQIRSLILCSGEHVTVQVLHSLHSVNTRASEFFSIVFYQKVRMIIYYFKIESTKKTKSSLKEPELGRPRNGRRKRFQI